ncbi:hypothetical protein F3I18_01130 [Pantoea sp. B_10]|nr:hypothetical protein F3I18_01130 [Pantoea sp. B_10]
MITLSKRVQSVSLSANAAARQLTCQLKEQGVDILDLPELRRRGLFREEYEFATLRENLGLPVV